jgi:hypothetical protein
MGNTKSSDSTPSSPWASTRQDPITKDIHISIDKSDGFYFTGERLSGTVGIPLSFFHQQLNNKSKEKQLEYLRKRSLRDTIVVELVGDATYSAEVDSAADSDGHSTHQVNVCRQRCFVIIDQDFDTQSNQIETTSDTQSISYTLPTTLHGTFQLQIPDGLPPSIINNRPPSVMYTLELNISSSRSRYQIPIILSSKGCLPHPTIDMELIGNAVNQHDIRLQAYLSRRCYRPGESISVRINYSNPQQRVIRSVTVTLIQFYRIHNDQYRLQLDGKEWIFDVSTMLPQREWSGETLLQLPSLPLQASYSNHSVGTTQQIVCELDYRIYIELNEKKGDDIHLTLPSINVTYQK